MNDLLDQLRKSRYFTTLTVYSTHKRLFESRVRNSIWSYECSTGLHHLIATTSLSRIAIRIWYRIVSVYINDVIVSSETLMDHINQMKAVFDNIIKEAGLMLISKKC